MNFVASANFPASALPAAQPGGIGILTIGVPSKGRLQENAAAFFQRAGLAFVQPRGARDYRGSVAGMPEIDIVFLSASEIAGELARGALHFGVTGADLLHETLHGPEAKVTLLAPLGFGHANVVVAVPEAWIDVQDLADIEEVAAALRQKSGRRLRVATKYVNLTRRFFKQHGIADYRIVESLGATEGAPAAGSADIIVDITTTGSTLAANALKVLEGGTILKSEASLVASRQAPWPEEARECARKVLARIQAEEEARLRREIRAWFEGPLGPALQEGLAGMGEILDLDAQGRLSLLVPREEAAGIADRLLAEGAKRVLVGAADYAFAAANPLYDRLIAAILTSAS